MQIDIDFDIDDNSKYFEKVAKLLQWGIDNFNDIDSWLKNYEVIRYLLQHNQLYDRKILSFYFKDKNDYTKFKSYVGK